VTTRQSALDWNATPETDAAPAAPVSRPAHRASTPAGRRWFVRCRDCLSVAAVDETLTRASCGACNGPIEIMGEEVAEDRLIRREHRTACDERCTSARGPICCCKCGAANHGSGRVAEVIYDAGPVPRVMMRGPVMARVTAQEFRDACAAVLAQLDPLRARRAVGHLPDGDFDRMRRLSAALTRAHAARTHAGRLKTLRDALKG
jgi:hypothetical protein